MVSGVSSILEAMLATGLEISLVIADRPCRGLQLAGAAGIPGVLIKRSFGPSFKRSVYTREVLETLNTHHIQLVAMAGFMTVLGPSIFDHFGGRILNTHPSLLPSFKGDHAVRDALAAGVKITGCTIHIATPELDNGPILAQAAVEVLPDDTEVTLQERIKQAERVLYPATIKTLMTKSRAK